MLKAFTNINELARDRELITPEICSQNDFYGHATALKNFIGWENAIPLPFVLEHGAFAGDFVWDVDISSPVPEILCGPTRRISVLKKWTDKAVEPIGPLIQYAKNLLTENQIHSEKKRLGKNLLVFPAHSTHHVSITYDIQAFIKEIKNISTNFDSVRICLYWKDILQGIAFYYEDAGFECVTAGHIFDPMFLTRLKSLLTITDMTMSNKNGSHIGYSILMGKPHYLWKQLYELAAPNDILQRDCSGFSFPAGLSKQLYKTFSVFNEELSAEQLNFADDYWGIGVSKSKADIIFIIDSILSNSSIHGLESIKEYFYGVYLPNIRDNISSIGSFQCASDEAVIPLAKFLCLQATKQSKSPLLTTRSFAKPVYVNLGCGNNFHSDWLNFDFSSHHPDVSQVNLRSGIPLPDNHADVVYHSHLLEHFTKDEAPQFIAECYRILKPGGLLRVAVPDLETIAKLYLLNMEKSLDGDLVAEDRYDWMMIEMYDQTVRNRSGGAMLDWWVQPQMRSGDFIIERLGDEAKGVIHALHNSITLPSPLPEPTEPLEIGRFRLSGEVHQWMYDRFSLARLLRHAGFRDIRRVGADESQIPGFSRFGLDTDVNSTTRKPDSLFVEAIK